MFETVGLARQVTHVEGDVRDLAHVRRVWRDTQPEIVFHLAAQAIVRESYRSPLETVTTNVVGTVDILEAAREANRPVVLVMITSDKCYENREWDRGYREDDVLGGRDVYSASKASAEILISSYRRSFFEDGAQVAVASTRAGNVIGGGDWAPDRIVPDCMRALKTGETLDVRNPHAVRPWQHVLEPVSGYLQLGAALLQRPTPALCGSWNFGPALYNTRTVAELVSRVVDRWGGGRWRDASEPGAPHEATLLRLDIEKAQRELGWRPRWNFEEAVAETVAWYRAHHDGARMSEWCLQQIDKYEAAAVAPRDPSLEQVG